MAARIPQAPTTAVDGNGTDEAETIPFNSSHFERLRQQGIITDLDEESRPRPRQELQRDDHDAPSGLSIHESRPRPRQELERDDHDAPSGLSIHELELEQAPKLRILFQQTKGDSKVTLAADQTEELPVGAAGAPNVLGASHSRAEIRWFCTAGRIKLAIFPIPCKDDILLLNRGNSVLCLESVPNRLDRFQIPPNDFGLVYPGSWELVDHETTLEMLLRPRRYRLLLRNEATKRPAEPSKHSAGSVVTGAAGSPSSSAEQDRKSLIRPTVVDDDMLNRIGLGKNQTLNIVDVATGQLEYSIKCTDRYFKHGKYADVFKAVWKDGSSQPAVVAVKLHKIAAAARPCDIDAATIRWKREFQAHRHLEHPCIANLLAFDSRLLALIIEYPDSYDLATPHWCHPSGPNAKYFKGNMDDACRILADVSSALAYFADQSLIHNDIKASNILYRAADSSRNIKASAFVIDFGLARNTKTHPTECGGGSPCYLPPEWLTKGTRNPPADVFSLGVVMLYLLRRISLPEKGKVWDVNDAQNHGSAASILMHDWLNHVTLRRDELTGPGQSSKETKLRLLVKPMLFFEEDRISASELARETAEWAV